VCVLAYVERGIQREAARTRGKNHPRNRETRLRHNVIIIAMRRKIESIIPA
jgi:hypothetical protein